MVGIEAQHDRVRERRVARVVLHDRDLFVLAAARARRAARAGRPRAPSRPRCRGTCRSAGSHRRGRAAVDRRRHPPLDLHDARAPSTATRATGAGRRREAGDRPTLGLDRHVAQRHGDAGADRLEVRLLRGPLLEERAQLRGRARRRASRRAPPAPSTRAASASSRARGRSTSTSTPTRAPVDDRDHRDRLRVRQAEREPSRVGAGADDLGLAVRRIAAPRATARDHDRVGRDPEPGAEDRPQRAVRDDVAVAHRVVAARPRPRAPRRRRGAPAARRRPRAAGRDRRSRR